VLKALAVGDATSDTDDVHTASVPQKLLDNVTSGSWLRPCVGAVP
jgi:hypothetical protein